MEQDHQPPMRHTVRVRGLGVKGKESNRDRETAEDSIHLACSTRGRAKTAKTTREKKGNLCEWGRDLYEIDMDDECIWG